MNLFEMIRLSKQLDTICGRNYRKGEAIILDVLSVIVLGNYARLKNPIFAFNVLKRIVNDSAIYQDS